MRESWKQWVVALSCLVSSQCGKTGVLHRDRDLGAAPTAGAVPGGDDLDAAGAADLGDLGGARVPVAVMVSGRPGEARALRVTTTLDGVPLGRPFEKGDLSGSEGFEIWVPQGAAGDLVVRIDALDQSGCVLARGTGTLAIETGGRPLLTVQLVRLPVPVCLLWVERVGAPGWVASYGGEIDCGERCSAEVPLGAQVLLVAGPAGKTYFSGWSQACSGAGPCELGVDRPIVVVAHFRPNRLVVRKLGGGRPGQGGMGRVVSWPRGIDCGADCSSDFYPGTEVRLDAQPAAGSLFAGWSGACQGMDTCDLTVNQGADVAAFFLESRPDSGRTR